MRVARKGSDLWLVLSEDEVAMHGIEPGDEVSFEPYGEGQALMEIANVAAEVCPPGNVSLQWAVPRCASPNAQLGECRM
jgi:hypothetical protein